MHRKLTLLLFLAPLLLVISCKKSNSSGPSALVGTWNFLDMKANTSTRATNSGITTVTVANYTTINNAGTAKFTNDSMSVAGLTYAVNTNAETYLYQGSVLYDSLSLPFSETIPPITETVKYKLIGSDSIYFPNGGFTPTGIPTGQGTGGRFTIKGDTLAINISGSQSSPIGLVTVVGAVYFIKQ
ncbi:MAG TPA: hypothetical protein VGQ51_03810 [Puia sp.]|jgi:hypothetical protein|nr:hypothetical protein [Puia sp.]